MLTWTGRPSGQGPFSYTTASSVSLANGTISTTGASGTNLNATIGYTGAGSSTLSWTAGVFTGSLAVGDYTIDYVLQDGGCWPGCNTATTKITDTVSFTVTAAPAAGVLTCLLYTSPSPRDLSTSRMPSSA